MKALCPRFPFNKCEGYLIKISVSESKLMFVSMFVFQMYLIFIKKKLPVQ